MALTRSRSFVESADIPSSGSSKRQRKDSVSLNQDAPSLRSKVGKLSPICVKEDALGQEDVAIDQGQAKKAKRKDTSSSKRPFFTVHDQRVINLFDGSRVNPIEEAILVLEVNDDAFFEKYAHEADVVEAWLLDSVENEAAPTPVSVSDTESTASSSVCDSEAMETWVISLINLDEDDSKWISDAESQWEEIKSNFPSPTEKVNHDDEGSKAKMASELLSGSAEWAQSEFNEPLLWPSDENCTWDSEWDSFTQSPRKDISGLGQQKEEPNESTESVRLRLRCRRSESKDGSRKRRILLVSGVSRAKLTEFKCGRHKNAFARKIKSVLSMLDKSDAKYKSMARAAAKGESSDMDHDVDSCSTPVTARPSSLYWDMFKTGIDVSLIDVQEEDSKWISDVCSDSEDITSNPPSSLLNSTTNESSQDEFSSTEFLTMPIDWDEVDSEGPLFWPLDSVNYHSSSLLEISPRKAADSDSAEAAAESKKPKSDEGKKRTPLLLSRLSVSKMIEFKRGHRKSADGRKMKAVRLSFGTSEAGVAINQGPMESSKDGLPSAS
ncbi:hypothetical protein Drorol1_Dr00007695 [Drosera rotundifolia]